MNQTDSVVVALVESVKKIEVAAKSAAQLIRLNDKSPLGEMMIKVLEESVDRCETARRHFRFGHDCIAARCDSDSHK
jgi:hypothetical protein